MTGPWITGMSGREWLKVRGGTVWVPEPAMRNADGRIRRRWFR